MTEQQKLNTIKKILKQKYGTITKASKELGYSRAYLSNVFGQRENLSSKFISKLIDVGFNKFWFEGKDENPLYKHSNKYVFEGKEFEVTLDSISLPTDLNFEQLKDEVKSSSYQLKVNSIFLLNNMPLFEFFEFWSLSLIFNSGDIPFQKVSQFRYFTEYIGNVACNIKEKRNANIDELLTVTIGIPRKRFESYIHFLKLSSLYRFKHKACQINIHKEKAGEKEVQEFGKFTKLLIENCTLPIAKLIEKKYFADDELRIVEQLIDFKIED
ncbi:MAG: hypothetical protein ACE364_00500 [Chlorobiota bacterium]